MIPTLDSDIDTSTDEDLLYQILMGDFPRKILILADEIGLFELIGSTGLSSQEVSSTLNISDRAAKAILSVLQSNGFLELNNGTYFLSPVSRKYLLRESPYYFGPFIESARKMEVNQISSYEGMKNLILTGEQKYPSFDTFEQTPEYAATFTSRMHTMSLAPSQWWVEKMDLSGGLRLLDIAGGSGAHSISALQQWPDLEAIVLDLEPVCKVTREYFERYGLADRGKTQVYDLWEGELPPADAHFFGNIFHDWTYEQGRFLAQKSFDALEKGGRIIIHEALYDDDKKGPAAIANFNLGMLLSMEGQQYSGLEFIDLLTNIGYQDIEVIPTNGFWSIVTGIKP